MGRRIIYKSDTLSGQRDIKLDKILNKSWVEKVKEFLKKFSIFTL